MLTPLIVGAYRGSIFADTALKKGFQTMDLAATPQVIAKMLMMKRFDLWCEGSVVVPTVLKEIGYSINEGNYSAVVNTINLRHSAGNDKNSQLTRAKP